MATCKICGQPHSVCGPRTTVVPVDQRIETKEKPTMALKRYRVQVQSGRSMVDTILKLTPEEAQRIGATEYVKEPLTPKQGVKSRTATVKPRTPRNKAATPEANKTAEPSESKPFEDATDPGASE